MMKSCLKICPDHPGASTVRFKQGNVCTDCGQLVPTRKPIKTEPVEVKQEPLEDVYDGLEAKLEPPDSLVAVKCDPDAPVKVKQEDESFEEENLHNSLFGEREAGHVHDNSKRRPLSERHRKAVLDYIKRMCVRGKLSDQAQELSIHLFQKVAESKLCKGKNLDVQAASCLYIACRQLGSPRTYKAMGEISKIPKSELGKCVKKIIPEIGVKVEYISAKDFMEHFCEKLSLPHYVQKTAVNIAEKAAKMDLVPGLSPVSVAGASIMMASRVSGQARTAKEISEKIGAAEVTIKQTYDRISSKIVELCCDDDFE